MSPEQVAQQFSARRTGPGKWMARCPAHHDHTPSLSICAGHNGMTLIHCFAGCPPADILASANLSFRDISNGRFENRTGWSTSRHYFEIDREKSETRRQRIALSDFVRRLSRAVEEIAARLARAPEQEKSAEELTQMYHQCLNRLHEAETELERLTRWS
jgi:hypothetical protein